MMINVPPSNEFTKEWLVPLLKNALESYDWSFSKRVKAAAESIDDRGLSLMLTVGLRPKGWNHFNTKNFSILSKQSVLRLLDLGILWFATGGVEAREEHAYHWTSFGYEVMKHLGIKQLTLEEFKKSMPREYDIAKESLKEWEKYKEKQRKLKEDEK